VLFVNNSATSTEVTQLAQGGAIAVDAGANLYVAHSYFLGNKADDGGAIYASHQVTNMNITRSAFDGNEATMHAIFVCRHHPYPSDTVGQ